MKLRYILTPVILAGSSLFFSGCDQSRLDVEPVNEYLSENFFITEEQVFQGLIAAYDPLGWTMAYGQWIATVMFGEIRSDNAHAGGDPSNNDQPGWQEFDDFTNTNSNVVLYPLYRRNYIGIFRANLVISEPQISSPQVDVYQAEAKFLRAFYHFELFKHFGPIPVVTELLTPGDVNLERNTMSEVFEAIVKDLNEAEALLPSSVSASASGRATRGAALALLGKVYLAWADLDGDDKTKFDLAAEALQKVEDLKIYPLADDMHELYAFGVKNPGESVFEIQHNNLYPSDWGWFEGIDGNGMVQLCGVRGICDDHPFLQMGSYCPVEDDAALTSIAELTEDIEDAGFSCNPVVDITQGNPIDYTGYWQDKFRNYKSYLGNNVNGGDPNLTKDANEYAIRMADVYLMLAEALHRGNGSDAEAMEYIDIVRERAAGPGDNTGNFRTASQLMADEGWSLLDVICYERRAELAMEGHRWFDLLRSGRATKDIFEGDPIREGNFSDQHIWIPIPLQELAVAPNLTEYPGPELFN